MEAVCPDYTPLRNEQFHFDQMTVQQSAQIVSPECCKGCQENLKKTVRLGRSCWQHAMPRHCIIVREHADSLLFEFLICHIESLQVSVQS